MSEEYELATIDLVILGVYIAAMLAIGYWIGRKKVDQEGYFLAGRGSHWVLVGFGLMAANLSGASFIGLAGAGYEDGISVWNYEWMATLVLCFFTVFILPFYLHSRISTVPEFLEKRYDIRSKYLFSGFTVFTAMAIESAGALYAGSLVLQLIFPEMPLWVLILGMTLLGGIYVMLGGLSAVMITDTIQGTLLLLAGGILFCLGLWQLGSWEAVREAAPPDGFTVFKPAGDDFMPWPGIFTGVLWLGIYYWMTNHVVVQKTLSARDLNHGRWGALFCAFLQLPLLFLLILPGTIGREFFPDLEKPDMIWPALTFELLPIGIRGLVLAALVAALMSTLDSALNGASSLVTNDFVRRFRSDWDDRRLLTVGRVVVGVMMLLAAIWAPQIARFPTIVEYFQSFLGHLAMPVVVVYLAGMFWPQATPSAAFWTLAAGIPIGLLAFVCGEMLELYDLQFLYGTGVILAIAVALLVGISLITKPRDRQDVEDLLWTRQTWQKETQDLAGIPWWKNYRVISVVLVILTSLMVAYFS